MCEIQTDNSYFLFAREIGIPTFLPENFPVSTIISVGSDAKYFFSNFIKTVEKVAKRPNIVEETLLALEDLKKQNHSINIGGMFFLVMVVCQTRNKEIENYVIKRLSKCHVYKVRVFEQAVKVLVSNTLKCFTNIIMERAKVLIKQLPDNLFKMNSNQKLQKSETID